MDSSSLNDKKNKILLLENEIRLLEQKKEQLRAIKAEYYHEYFETKREDYALLTDVPPILNKLNDYILWDYSVLNVDTIGKIICKLIKKYDNEDFVSKRMIKNEWWSNTFSDYPVELPILVIGREDEIEYQDKRDRNIIIEYNMYASLDKYPTNNPVLWKTSDNYDYYEGSNYTHLIGYDNGLHFEYHNREYIKELIYSLAYYQQQHDIKQMTPTDTWNTYRKIYRKK